MTGRIYKCAAALCGLVDAVAISIGISVVLCLLVIGGSEIPRDFLSLVSSLLTGSAYAFVIWMIGGYHCSSEETFRTAGEKNLYSAATVGALGLGHWVISGGLTYWQTILWLLIYLWVTLYQRTLSAKARSLLVRSLVRRAIPRRALVLRSRTEESECREFVAHNRLIIETVCDKNWQAVAAAEFSPGAKAKSMTLVVQQVMDCAGKSAVGVIVITSSVPLEIKERLCAHCREAGLSCWLIKTEWSIKEPCHPEHAVQVLAAPPGTGGLLLLKDVCDMVLSALLLLLGSPLLFGLAGVIKLTSGSPVFLRQTRDGRFGKPFVMVKFRTMRLPPSGRTCWDEDRQVDILHKPRRDPRVTRLGYLLRRSSLDELPQLWNVLKGDMSLVGPRPMLRSETPALPFPHGRRRLAMKPGMTGLWQVSGRSDIQSIDERLALDLAYVDNWSFKQDLAILVRTVPAVLMARGAQ